MLPLEGVSYFVLSCLSILHRPWTEERCISQGKSNRNMVSSLAFHISTFISSHFSFLSVLDCPALTLQSSRSLDALSDLKLQRLEAELEGARHEAQGACQREEELKAECERLKEEIRQMQNSQRERVSIGLFGVTLVKFTASGQHQARATTVIYLI